MKIKKLNLNELKVKSFVTEFDSGIENTIKGGAGTVETGCTAASGCQGAGCGTGRNCPTYYCD